MSRNRTFYQVLGVFAGPGGTAVTGGQFSSGNSGENLIQQLQRVQTCNHSFSVTRTDINQFGQLGAISREIIEQPTVSFDTSWYLADVSNEKNVGFNVDGAVTAIRDFLNKTQDERNYFLAIAPEGQDIYGWTGQNQVIQITNATISSYSTEGAVGGIPTSSISVEGLNWAVSTGSIEQELKAVNPTDGSVIPGLLYTVPVGTSGTAGSVAALRPGDISVDISNAALGLNIQDLKIQSYNVSFDLARENLQKLGSRFAFAKEIQFPVTVSVSITANIGDLEEADLSQLLCEDSPYDLDIVLRDPACVGSGPIAARFTAKGVKIDSQEFSNDIGSNSSVTINYSTQLAGPNDTSLGIFMSGKY